MGVAIGGKQEERRVAWVCVSRLEELEETPALEEEEEEDEGIQLVYQIVAGGGVV